MSKYIEVEGVMRACFDSFVKTNNQAYREIFAMIEAVPAADVVEVRHGRWVIEKKMFPYIYPKWSCSECGEETTETTGWGTKPRYNYCPNCGAKMDGDTE